MPFCWLTCSIAAPLLACISMSKRFTPAISQSPKVNQVDLKEIEPECWLNASCSEKETSNGLARDRSLRRVRSPICRQRSATAASPVTLVRVRIMSSRRSNGRMKPMIRKACSAGMPTCSSAMPDRNRPADGIPAAPIETSVAMTATSTYLGEADLDPHGLRRRTGRPCRYRSPCHPY